MFSFLLAIAVAAAPATESKAVRAEKLFREGRALLKADLPLQACPKFRQSLEADPALGTLLNLADCEERTGAMVQAWLHFNEAAGWAERNREADRAQIAKDRASTLKAKLSWLALSAEKPVPGLVVKVNDMPVELGATPQSVPLNAGEAVVVASAEGFESWRTRVLVGNQATVSLKVPALVEKNAAVAAAPPTPAPAPEAKPAELGEPSDAPVEHELTPAPMVSAEQNLVTSAPASRGVKPGAMLLIAGGGVALIGGIIGLGLSLDVHNRTMRQQVGGPDYLTPTVTKEQFQALQWAYPLSWVVTGVGAASILGGVAWTVIPTGNGVSVQGSM
jgi:hypothetical protein